jgi:hypothetical protein
VTFAARESTGAGITHPDQQPTVIESSSGKWTEFHRYFTKVRPDVTYTYHVISTAIEVPLSLRSEIRVEMIWVGMQGSPNGVGLWCMGNQPRQRLQGMVKAVRFSLGKELVSVEYHPGLEYLDHRHGSRFRSTINGQLEAVTGVLVTGKRPLRLPSDVRRAFVMDSTTHML